MVSTTDLLMASALRATSRMEPSISMIEVDVRYGTSPNPSTGGIPGRKPVLITM